MPVAVAVMLAMLGVVVVWASAQLIATRRCRIRQQRRIDVIVHRVNDLLNAETGTAATDRQNLRESHRG